MENLQKMALLLIRQGINENSQLVFDNEWFTFYKDSCGQRLHKIIPYKSYGKLIKDHYEIIRVLSFENKGDKGKDGAVLGILDLTKCKVNTISDKSIDFQGFKIVFNS